MRNPSEVNDLAGAIELLREAKRYCRSDPAASRDLVGRAMDVVAEAVAGDAETLRRLIVNLAVGSRFVVAAPDVVRGYIDGAAFELELILGRQGEGNDS